MNFTSKFFSRPRKAFGAAIGVFTLIAAIFSNAAAQTVFTNSASITISDASTASPYPSEITVSGLGNSIPATPGSVKVTINGFSHSFPDDVGMVLVGPTGAAIALQDGAGDDPDMVNVTYTFSDTGAVVLPGSTAWTAGTYKPTNYYFPLDSYPAPGPGTTYSNPGPGGSGTATLTSVFGGTNPNGVWKLFVVDLVGGDSGSISGGWSLEINAGVTTTTQHTIDFDGNGKSDFAVVRNTGGGPGGQLTWYIALNGPGTAQAYQWGVSGDFYVPEDYDGDNKTDVAIWRPGSPATSPTGFYILQSQTNTLRYDNFGQSGDDPKVVGDYDGDGKADVAVYRAGASAGQQSTWFYRTTANGPVNYISWGKNGDFPAPGDYDGDGKNDFVVQRNDGGGQGRFWMLMATGVQNNSNVFGAASDVIVTGDYDGDGKTDLAVSRAIGGQVVWFYRPSSGGADVNYQVFGDSILDFRTQGDYDGDGKTDFAVWRPSTTPGESAFWYKSSTSGFATSVPFGANGDYPVANINTH